MTSSDAPNCSVTYNHHYDDSNSFIIQVTVKLSVVALQSVSQYYKILFGCRNKLVGLSPISFLNTGWCEIRTNLITNIRLG
jgi:hypothetical protein